MSSTTTWIWHQWLLVKPGTYQLTATQKGQTIWSGPVTVKAGERVIVISIITVQTKTKDFKPGLKLGPEPRFEAGVASANGSHRSSDGRTSAQANQVNCGQSTQLNWKSTDAVDTSIYEYWKCRGNGDSSRDPDASDNLSIDRQRAGRQREQTVTVNVNAQPTATLALSQPEVRYHKIGDKVVEQDSATLNWSASNANQVNDPAARQRRESGSRRSKPCRTRAAPAPSIGT